MPRNTKKKIRPECFRSQLERACGGLFYVSETDSSVEPVFGKKISKRGDEQLLSAVGVSAASAFQIIDTEVFFARLTSQKEWFPEKKKRNAAGFAALKRLLESELEDLKVFRLGRIRLTIYILGVRRDGTVAGVRMFAVET